MLYLGRIHPVKGIDLLLRAWGELHGRKPDWRLVIIGQGEAQHEREVRELAAALSLERVQFVGALYGEAKSSAYFNADVFVLPSHSENFGMAVAEALAHGCPAIVSRGAPWSGIERERCGWWVRHDGSELVAALDAAMSLSPERLAEMGRRGRAWMERDFGWDSVAGRMEASYKWLLGAGTMPDCVRLD